MDNKNKNCGKCIALLMEQNNSHWADTMLKLGDSSNKAWCHYCETNLIHPILNGSDTGSKDDDMYEVVFEQEHKSNP